MLRRVFGSSAQEKGGRLDWITPLVHRFPDFWAPLGPKNRAPQSPLSFAFLAILLCTNSSLVTLPFCTKVNLMMVQSAFWWETRRVSSTLVLLIFIPILTPLQLPFSTNKPPIKNLCNSRKVPYWPFIATSSQTQKSFKSNPQIRANLQTLNLFFIHFPHFYVKTTSQNLPYRLVKNLFPSSNTTFVKMDRCRAPRQTGFSPIVTALVSQHCNIMYSQTLRLSCI